jgi:hypothetical protein
MNELYIKRDDKFYRLKSQIEIAAELDLQPITLRQRRARAKVKPKDEVYIEKGWYKIIEE